MSDLKLLWEVFHPTLGPILRHSTVYASIFTRGAAAPTSMSVAAYSRLVPSADVTWFHLVSWNPPSLARLDGHQPPQHRLRVGELVQAEALVDGRVRPVSQTRDAPRPEAAAEQEGELSSLRLVRITMVR